ncbi:MAG: hypothetical protein M5U15_12385 [Kiritimatiellae bacterium]|nr:hypothetical protein [Kiritimatiellia bacterium]
MKYTFDCKTVPHVTLKSIAQNQALDPIFDKWEPILAEKLAALNKALGSVSDELRNRLKLKLAAKEKADGKKSITDADRRRWILPQRSAGVSPVIPGGRDARPPVGWQHWEVPFDTDPDWPKALQDALTEYRKAWRGKMDEVNACIAARADQEELVDQPFVEKGKVRVSGPFTMEGVIPAEESIDDEESPIIGAPEELPTWEGGRPARHENDAGETPAPPFLNPFDEIEMKEHRLPHWQQGECYVFVTWRLADSLPKEKLDAWRERKAAFMKACPPPWDEKDGEGVSPTIQRSDGRMARCRGRLLPAAGPGERKDRRRRSSIF